MSYMFSGCSSLKSLDLSTFDTTNVKDISCIFSYSRNLNRGNVKISKYGRKILSQLEEF